MRAARFHAYGAPDVLVIEEAPDPHAGDGSVRIQVQATSVNPIDVLLRAGRLVQFLPLALPAVPGRDAVGVVDEVGAGVTGTQIGDVVFGLGGVSDTTAEFAVLTAWSAVPAGWSTAQAGAAGLASATAAAALEALGDLTGRTLLIEGATGAVGSAAAAFALAAGATVIGTGREANHPHLEALGVLPTTYGPGLAERVAVLAPGGVDAALHSAPSTSLPDLLRIVGDPSRVVTVVDGEGAARLGVVKVDARNDSALLRFAAALGRDGLYKPRVDHELALADIAVAHTLAENGGGKVVVTIA
ncbi:MULTISPECIES: alcohol dehydrogenase catalytic domain-containing protein [unclassified Rathayibacter]|uniref:alcohol dehydrogenase catalytic domain-containing protein n=1 Tax=unclassified Rathayibacter TaxID=2609250 RepID=UPI0006FA265F|nr:MULTISPECIES: alcohol dehydrogenase catalytic domain-containing protein [unclassified Rathayibacter]KQQ03813.1 NADPH:quinone reductase [Rathayibacter sp. Leaf294]KQS12270.1 NADPH:quinone reductase [Rathayibacter sp. Leaf185]